ncbi:Transposon TX1 uncharacterized protein [Merluccius polli]|uniref:Transposon TX1 uncharacterized protein n=1 Tax=Merluccius polli TaxID=89951 RepID=A0AA47NBX8_MERPO|nr:Transposon TX1 uncharacterized protein [Merluccius polli]
MKDLETDIVELERLSESTTNQGYFEILKVKKLALADLLDAKVQGALVRSRYQASTEMDAPSSFFFGLEKRSGQRRVIHSLLADTGQTLVEPSQIRKRAVQYYSALYKSEYEEQGAEVDGFCDGLPQVSEEINAELNRPLLMEELKAALQGMQGRRAPGMDGLSVEFYKAFWDIFAEDLLDVFNESLASGSMPMSCRRAVITLLPKKGNLQDIKNWRPVSLLCVDYKLLSKLFASRLGMAMEHLIHRDQTYCVSGRSMVDNIHLIRDVLDISNSLGCNTGLISLDQEKAFDRVEHNFLWKVMEKFGFNAGFIAKIKNVTWKRDGFKYLGVFLGKEHVVKKNWENLDISSSVTPGLTVALLKTKTLCLQQLVDAVGPALNDTQALGSLLGLHSVRVAGRLLELWCQQLTGRERSLLMDYGNKKARPDPADPFPDIFLSPGLGQLTGPLLAHTHPGKLTMNKADKRTWYFNCVKSIHKAGLCNRPPTVWSNKLGADPQWRVLYKPPLKKRTADLQWRILHGAVASNAFISVLNPAVFNTCPFCSIRETVYHVFTECKRLTSFFSLLTLVFSFFDVVFTERVFIMGAAYRKERKEKWQLLNYLSGEAKMAI